MKMPKLNKRNLGAILALILLSCFLLVTVRGPVLTDGVAFYAPIMILAFLVWRFVVFCKHRSRSYTFLAGALGGLLGTMLWPTWIVVGLMIVDPQAMPTMFFAICFVASIVGGAVALILSLGFDRQPAPNQTEPILDQDAMAKAV